MTPLIHRIGYAARSSYVLNVATSHVPERMVTDGSISRSE